MTEDFANISSRRISDFLAQHRLPEAFRHIAEQHYLPLARRLPAIRGDKRQLLLGINGAQGTGKSTLADFLRLAAESMFDWAVAVLSIDDFYLTLKERQSLAHVVHPLLLTRGPPGTHDVEMLSGYLDRLGQLGKNQRLSLPRFDKSTDDRADESLWPVVEGPIDLVILEGWCVGTRAQSDIELDAPVNLLEEDEDSDRAWRIYVNDQLRMNYEPVFRQLDFLVFLRAPSFDAILRWRAEQEEKLAAVSPKDASGLMSREQITRFLQYYERLTRANLATLPGQADLVFELDEHHAISS